MSLQYRDSRSFSVLSPEIRFIVYGYLIDDILAGHISPSTALTMVLLSQDVKSEFDGEYILKTKQMIQHFEQQWPVVDKPVLPPLPTTFAEASNMTLGDLTIQFPYTPAIIQALRPPLDPRSDQALRILLRLPLCQLTITFINSPNQSHPIPTFRNLFTEFDIFLSCLLCSCETKSTPVFSSFLKQIVLDFGATRRTKEDEQMIDQAASWVVLPHPMHKVQAIWIADGGTFRTGFNFKLDLVPDQDETWIQDVFDVGTDAEQDLQLPDGTSIDWDVIREDNDVY